MGFVEKMSGKTKQFRIILLLASLLVVGLIVLNGCKGKKSESAEPNAVTTAAIKWTGSKRRGRLRFLRANQSAPICSLDNGD
jgi:hypothetical protein